MKTTEVYAKNFTLAKLLAKLETAMRMIQEYGLDDRLACRIKMLTAAIQLRQTWGWK